MVKKIGVVLAGGLAGIAGSAQAAMPALDPAAAVTYLETNAGGGIAEVGVAVLSLAALAMAVTWIKATFFG